MKATIPYVAAFAILSLLLCPAELLAQDNLWTGATGNWTDSTWNQFGSPPDPTFDTRGVIGSTVGSGSPTGIVNVNSDLRASFPSPTVVLGDGAGTNGTLNITSAGALKVVTLVSSSGDFETGLNSGVGFLNVDGVLEIDGKLSASTNADASTTVQFRGSANVTAGSGFLDRNFIVDGSSVSASFAGDLILGQSGTHTWRIPAAGASTILVGTNVDLGGTLRVEFPDGAPAVGATWNLVDSATVDVGEVPSSGFSNIDQSIARVGVGQKFVVKPVAGGANGMLSQLSLEQHPVLVVDRATGATSIRNFGASTTVSFDTYSISSALGKLNPAGWSSMSPTNGWIEANPSSTAIAELNVSGSDSVAGGSSISLGSPIDLAAPAVFGQENEDIRFRFTKPDESVFTEGTVVYTGLANNTLTLNVDPDTGEAQIINGSSFTVSIDTYDVSSVTGSLESADGSWNSLEDQAATGGNWFEANVSNTRISELLPIGGMELAPNAIVSLGTLFDEVNGFEDLNFQFAIVEDSRGDFDQDGDIDGGDFLAWQRGESSTALSASDLADWEGNFGTVLSSPSGALLTGKVLYSPLIAVSSAVAVPEPNSAVLLLAGFSLLFEAVRRPVSSKC